MCVLGFLFYDMDDRNKDTNLTRGKVTLIYTDVKNGLYSKFQHTISTELKVAVKEMRTQIQQYDPVLSRHNL